jgi:hypothetical protein
MATNIEKLDDEIRRLQAEVAGVEIMPPTIAERVAAVEGELRQAEQIYRTYGLKVSAAHPLETAHLQRQALVGACMVVGGRELLKVERQRIEAQGEGMTVADRERRIAELRAAMLKAAARRELLVREIEGAEFMPRPVHPELVVYRQADVERLAR